MIFLCIESEVANQIYRMMQLHENFSIGSYEEMNTMYADDFQGMLYIPHMGEVEHYNAEQIRAGNKEAAEFYKGKNIKFIYSGLAIVPQTETQAAVSYEVIFKQEDKMMKGLSLEVWRKELDGKWRMIRWYEEKGKLL